MRNAKQLKMNQEILDNMRQCVLLRPLDDGDFDSVVQTARIKQFSEGHMLFSQGAVLTDIYLLISGSVKLQRLSSNGDEKVIELISPGQTFAEAVLFFGGSKYPVSAIAVVPSVVVAIEAKNYLTLINKSNELCINLLGALSQRLHWMLNEVDRLTLHNATFRLVDYLLSHVPDGSNERVDVSFAAPKNVVASRLSIKPETLSRTLKDLSNKNLISINRSRITLLEIEKLRQLISLEI